MENTRSSGCCGGGKRKSKKDGGAALKIRSDSIRQNKQAQASNKEPLLVEAKIVLIGDMAVGKSSIAGRFNHGDFQGVYQNTIGGAYFQKILMIPDPDGPEGQMVQAKIHIWDTGGQEQFRSMLKMYYKDADAALIVFDLSSGKTFNSVRYWVEEMERNCNNDRTHFVLAMAGNKCDIEESQKQVSLEEATELSKEADMMYFETSAKTGEGIEDLFGALINQVIRKKKQTAKR